MAECGRRREPGPRDLCRGAPAANSLRRPRRRCAGNGGCVVSGALAEFAGRPIHTGRVGRQFVWCGRSDLARFLNLAFHVLNGLLVFFIARTGDALPAFTLLLAGITLNFVFGALIMFIHYAANFSQGYLMTRWTMGAVDTADMQTVARSAPFVIACFFGLLWLSPQLNPLTAGEEWAASRGVYVRRIKHLVYFIGSILTGTVTASSGPIGFVGLIVPHTVRLIGGPDHRTLIPASFFLGSAFLVLCDTLARTLFAPAEIPVGVITAILGGPFFILLLKRKRGELW